jgi:hypothetical protein
MLGVMLGRHWNFKLNTRNKTAKMISIVKAKAEDCQLLADIGKVSFIESHGNSALPADIDSYVNAKYNRDVFKQELNEPQNIYHTIYHDKQPVGYSKIILNSQHSNIQLERVTKLERLYLLSFLTLTLNYLNKTIRQVCGYLYGKIIKGQLVFIKKTDLKLLVAMILNLQKLIQIPTI